MITFNGRDKFLELFTYLESQGINLYQLDGQFVSNSSEAATQAAVDSFTLDMAKAGMSARVIRLAKEKRDKVVGSYSPGEMASWNIKEAEALAYVDEATANTVCPRLYAEALERETTVASIKDRVIANSIAFSNLEAKISGHSGKLRDDISIAPTFDALLAIDINSGWVV